MYSVLQMRHENPFFHQCVTNFVTPYRKSPFESEFGEIGSAMDRDIGQMGLFTGDTNLGRIGQKKMFDQMVQQNYSSQR